MMDGDSEFDPAARLYLITALCRMRKDYAFGAKDMDQLVRVLQIVSDHEEDDKTTAEVDRLGRLARALKGTFPLEHPVWSFVRWSRVIEIE